MPPTGENAAFDLNVDGVINEADTLVLVEQRLRTRLGDANLDGVVDGVDLQRYQSFSGQAGGWYDGDFNGNGVVDGGDFLIWQRRFGNVAASLAASAENVPEPTTLGLLGLGCAALACYHSRRHHGMK